MARPGRLAALIALFVIGAAEIYLTVNNGGACHGALWSRTEDSNGAESRSITLEYSQSTARSAGEINCASDCPAINNPPGSLTAYLCWSSISF